MIKKLVSMVKRVFEKVEAKIVNRSVGAVYEEVEPEVTKSNPVSKSRPIQSVPKVEQVICEPTLQESACVELEESPTRVHVPLMSWKQFKEYNNQVNSYLDRRVCNHIGNNVT